MCVQHISSPEILSEDLIAYKTCRPTSDPYLFQSRNPPKVRKPQTGFSSSGSIAYYKIGEKAFSSFDNTPGFYCYTSLYEAKQSEGFIAEFMRQNNIVAFLEVKIPAGTRIMRAKTFSLPSWSVVLTESLIPIKKH